MKYTFTECMIKTWYGVFTIKEQNNELCMPSFSTRNWPHNKHYVSNARFFHLKSIWITCHLTSRQQNIFIFVVKAVNLIFGQLCIKHIIMMLNKRKKYKAVIHGYLVGKINVSLLVWKQKRASSFVRLIAVDSLQLYWIYIKNEFAKYGRNHYDWHISIQTVLLFTLLI